jgi:hypothetical protein
MGKAARGANGAWAIGDDTFSVGLRCALDWPGYLHLIIGLVNRGT